MKKIFFIAVIVILGGCLNSSPIHAAESEGGLNLNIDILENKKNNPNVSSLTDSNNLNIFTENSSNKLNTHKLEKQADEQKFISIIFTEELESLEIKTGKEKLFSTIVTFDKITDLITTTQNYYSYIAGGTIILCVGTYFSVKKYYQLKAGKRNENSSNI
ncbi:MAG: hypothetical protein ACRC17_12075 [Culicoidibacterales bacterium]